MSRAELEYLSTTQANFIGCQASKPIVCIVQDCLLSCYLMTKNTKPIPRDIFMNLCMSFSKDLDWYAKFSKITEYTGKNLFSLLLPMNFQYHFKKVVIKDGWLIQGEITKVNIGATATSILALLYKEYSPLCAKIFVDNVQFIANAYMLYHSFSIGIQDCLTRPSARLAIQKTIQKCFLEASNVETENEFIKEAKINMALGKARDIGMRLAKEGLFEDNHFIDTVSAGSKGDYFNISQIMGLLGQQNLSGMRIKESLNKEKRTLPHYPIESSLSSELKYESKGFISSSFLKGLNPKEFWASACAGREGITDTACRTSNSGYLQRKLVKIMEDLQVKYDYTVRNAANSIISFAYGTDHLDGSQTVLVDGEPSICNIERIVNRLHSNMC